MDNWHPSRNNTEKVSSDATESLLQSLAKGTGSVHWFEVIFKMEICLFSKLTAIEASAVKIFGLINSLVSLKTQACQKGGFANVAAPVILNLLQGDTAPCSC